jgi:hypothetical protein
MKRPKTTRERLLIAQAQLRGVKKLSAAMLEATSRMTRPMLTVEARRDGPAKFIQGWVVPRGYASVTQALDEDGQVWERVIQLSPKEPGKRQEVMDSWWEKIGMTRK